MTELAANLKRLRERSGYTQQEMADVIQTHRTSYSKMESGQQEVPLRGVVRVAERFGLTVDELVRAPATPGAPPGEVAVADHDAAEQLRLIGELDDDDRAAVQRIVDQMLTNKRFRSFFKENAEAA